MLLDYHKHLLQLAIDKNYFTDMNYKYVNLYLLNSGLHYPDIPCNNLIIQNNKVKYQNYKACKAPFSLIYLLNEKKQWNYTNSTIS